MSSRANDRLRQPLSIRLRAVLLAVLTALAALLLPALHASASALPAAQTRAGAMGPTTSTIVGVAEHIAAGQHLGRAPSQLQVVSGHCVAAEGPSAIPSIIYREGTPRPGNLTPRDVDNGALSFRDSLSNPVGSAGRPVLRPGEPYIGIDTSRLPPGSVVVDNVPPGHVSVTGVSVDDFLAALIERGKFPK